MTAGTEFLSRRRRRYRSCESGLDEANVIVGWSDSPFRLMQRMAEGMDRVFEDFPRGRGELGPRGESGLRMWTPDVDVVQKDNQLTIHADLLGLKRDEVSVEVTDDAVIRHAFALLRRCRVRAARRAASRRSRGPFVRTAFRAACLRAAAGRRRAALFA